MNALRPKAISFERTTLMPIVAAAVSLDRIAVSTSPVVDSPEVHDERRATTQNTTASRR